MLRTVQVPLKTGGTFSWLVANPFALLWVLGKGPHFGRFLKEHIGDITSRLAFYSDETTPGNVLRPDVANRRKVQCIYWTFMEWPYWFRARPSGWLPFGYVEVRGIPNGIFHPWAR